jgi:hypothetical protein
MAVDPNVTRFVDLVVNAPEFRAAISSGDRETIKAALLDDRWELTLSANEIEAAADALLKAGNLSSISNLEEVLSHQPIGSRFN